MPFVCPIARLKPGFNERSERCGFAAYVLNTGLRRKPREEAYELLE
jgi:hypothetical protein